MTVAHPWRALRSLPGVRVEWSKDDALLQGADAWWYPDQDVILMDARAKQVVKRCALAHELAHREHRDVPCDGRAGRRQELAADRWAARWLIGLEPLAEILRWTSCEVEAATELWVTLHLLRVRLAHLDPAERRYLGRRLSTAP
ncbi:ImmA/IrrE family metallo-endopeptidase [Microlunatus sp. GCM10028923]|uniref:ImmA/IrrE family metallo-endopeptidase n=1 Tax=Microlunatus sp. GCM10028923 TaxID=3273400 RepID=UPI0036160FA8